MPKKQSLDLAITLTLSEEDWTELYYAVVDKQVQVHNAAPNSLTHGMMFEEAQKWRDSLDRVVRVVAEVLDKNGITY